MMLEVENLQAAYGASQVLFGVDLNVAPGEMVTLLGRNGMGKPRRSRRASDNHVGARKSCCYCGEPYVSLPQKVLAPGG